MNDTETTYAQLRLGLNSSSSSSSSSSSDDDDDDDVGRGVRGGVLFEQKFIRSKSR